MNFVLLLGAGFTRNWGGWLALEAFEYLLGSPELDDGLRDLLWKHKDRGGFEAALAELQQNHVRSNRSELEPRPNASVFEQESPNKNPSLPEFPCNRIPKRV